MATAFVFPGQGSQYVGMGASLIQRFPEAAEVYAQADDALGFPLSQLILHGPLERLTETENTQPAILTCEVAFLRVLQKHGVQADLAAGHSLGEYAALVACGALDFPTAVKLVRLRGRYMQDAVPLGVGTMMAVLMLDGALVEFLCKEASIEGSVVEPAGFNCPGQVACAGHVDAIDRLEAEVAKNRGMTKRLTVSAPFHSSLLKKAADDLGHALADVHVSPLTFPYVANVDAHIIHDANGVKRRLIEQVMKPVLWEQSIATMKIHDIDRLIEIGPGKTLQGLVRKIDRKLNMVITDDPKSLDALLGA